MIVFLMCLSMAVPVLSDLSWYPVHDTVMGGRSKGGVRMADGGIAFEGYLSLENNGGFASIRSRDVPDALMQSQGIKIRVVGDGRTYLATIRMKEYNRMLYLRAPFQTTKDKEEEIERQEDDKDNVKEVDDKEHDRKTEQDVLRVVKLLD